MTPFLLVLLRHVFVGAVIIVLANGRVGMLAFSPVVAGFVALNGVALPGLAPIKLSVDLLIWHKKEDQVLCQRIFRMGWVRDEFLVALRENAERKEERH